MHFKVFGSFLGDLFACSQRPNVPSRRPVVFFDEAMRVCANYNQDYKLAIRIFEIFRKHDSMYLNVFRESNI